MDPASLVTGLATGALNAAFPAATGDEPLTDSEKLELSVLAGLIATQPTPQAAALFVRQWKGNKRMMVENADWKPQIRNPQL